MQRLTILKLKTLLSLETFYVELTVDIKQENFRFNVVSVEMTTIDTKIYNVGYIACISAIEFTCRIQH